MFGKIDFRDGKFHLIVNGHVVTKSADRRAVEVRADQRGIKLADYEEAKPKHYFSINERFDFLCNFVNMIAHGELPSLLISGEGGLGKTFSVVKTLRENGFIDMQNVLEDQIPPKKSYVMVKGFSTARALYTTLYENRDRVIVFDDTDSIMKDGNALNLLKAALDSYDDRYVTWNSERMFGSEVPNCFKFNGSIIFISNLNPEKIDQAVRTRAICVDVSMTAVEKIERMNHIIHQDGFMPDIDVASKELALDLIDRHKDEINNLSLRTLISVTKIAHGGGDNWERMALYSVLNG